MAPQRTITRANLAASIRDKVPSLNETEIRTVFEAFLEEILDRLDKDENIKLTGFGTFSVRHKSERLGRHFKDGQPAVIKPRRAVSFRSSPLLRARINGDASES